MVWLSWYGNIVGNNARGGCCSEKTFVGNEPLNDLLTMSYSAAKYSLQIRLLVQRVSTLFPCSIDHHRLSGNESGDNRQNELWQAA